jgi:hypothetical protein
MRRRKKEKECDDVGERWEKGPQPRALQRAVIGCCSVAGRVRR